MIYWSHGAVTYENLWKNALLWLEPMKIYVNDTLTIHHHGHVSRIIPVYLIGGSEHDFLWLFHTVGNFIILTDEVHHFSEGRSTTSQITNHGKSPFFMSKSIIYGPFSSSQFCQLYLYNIYSHGKWTIYRWFTY